MTDTLPRPGDAPPSEPEPSSSEQPLRPYSDVEYVFEPHEASLVSPRTYIQEVWLRRRFAIALAQSEIRGPRASTVLGEIWGVLDPLFQAAIYWFLITIIRGSGSSAMLAMIMSGFFLFSFTATAMSEGGRSIQRNKGLVLNSTFPRALLPAAAMYKGFLALVPSMIVYAIIHVALRAPIGAGLFMLPLLFFLQILISAGLALILATLTVYIRDMSNILDYIMRILLFVTPIIYPVSQLPGFLRTILIINPIFALFASYQAVFTGQLPGAGYILASVFWAVVLPIAGFRIFVSHERGFAMRL